MIGTCHMEVTCPTGYTLTCNKSMSPGGMHEGTHHDPWLHVDWRLTTALTRSRHNPGCTVCERKGGPSSA